MTFLSTPSARRATRSCTGRAAHRPFLSTPSARRATVALCHLVFSFGISIHALREEGDRSPVSLRHAQSLFLSTPSARRANGCTLASEDVIRFLSTPSARRATQKQRQNLYFLINYTTFCTNLEEL